MVGSYLNLILPSSFSSGLEIIISPLSDFTPGNKGLITLKWVTKTKLP